MSKERKGIKVEMAYDHNEDQFWEGAVSYDIMPGHGHLELFDGEGKILGIVHSGQWLSAKLCGVEWVEPPARQCSQPHA